VIEWRADDHVLLTGPAEFEFSGTFEPFTGSWRRDQDSSQISTGQVSA